MVDSANTLLDVRGLTVYYGKALALDGISLQVNEGEIVSIVGANGAGKTTAIRTISGLKQPASGEILFAGKRIDKMPAYDVMRLGVVQVPAGRGAERPHGAQAGEPGLYSRNRQNSAAGQL
jgi:branched-chain amino acid transport system ATP-binding protein